MQTVLFITNVEHLKISSDLGRGEKVGDTFYLTNNKSTIEKLITPYFNAIAGTLETNYLKSSNAIAYSIEECDPFPDKSAALSFLSKRLSYVRQFLHMLWFVKDNAVNVDLGYLEHPYKHPYKGKVPTNVSRNSYSFFFTNSLGELIPTEFSREELRKARELIRIIPADKINIHTQSLTEEGVGRFERAYYFLQASRANSDLGVKISNYCTCFEALFSNDARELSHKLAERIACFLEKNLSDRIKIFHAVKKAYNIRSKIVHGAKGSKKLQEDIKKITVSCDNILRRILSIILEKPSQHQQFLDYSKEKLIEEYFLSLVLSPQENLKQSGSD